MRKQERREGFTLIEILIVISIIAVIASMILGGVQLARKKAYVALAASDVSNFHNALKRYYQDTGRYPGMEYPDGENAFPALFEVLFDERPPRGKGGPSAPYIELKENDVAVWDDDAGDGGDYRQASSEEIYDNTVKKYILDPWQRPYVYHENKNRPRREYMHNPASDIYSTGPDKIDQTIDGEKDGHDDIGSW